VSGASFVHAFVYAGEVDAAAAGGSTEVSSVGAEKPQGNCSVAEAAASQGE